MSESEHDHDVAGGVRPDPRLINTSGDFARSLSALRRQACLSIRDLAKIMQKESADAPSAATLGGWFSGSHLPTLKLIRFVPRLLAICGVSDPAKVAEWLAALERVRSMPGPRPAGHASPFRGLAPYEPEHAEYFFGRDSLIARLLALAATRHASGSPVIVVGPSGSGKSSLLRAGLIPAAERGDPPFVGSWSHVLFTPGASPVPELARHIAHATARTPGSVEAKLLENPRSVVGLLAEPGAGTGPLLIVVDQLEELFTADIGEAHEHLFIEALCSAARTAGYPSARARAAPLVVLGLRADFYARALLVPQLVPVLQDAQLVIGPMNEAELREAITAPARKARVEIADSLVELLVRELAPPASTGSGAAHEAGALPLLSHALLATWDHAKTRRLTVEHYRATGGIEGAVAATAETAFDALTQPQQDMARRLFMRLVHLGDDAGDTRRKVPRAGLLDAYTGTYGADLREALDRFIVARLITADDRTVEITHEALLTAWPRLTKWLSTDRTWLRLHRRLDGDAKEWAETGRDPDGLYRGGRLQMIREQVQDHGRGDELNALEREFLDASLARETRAQHTARRRVRRRYQAVAVVAVLAVVVATVIVYARQVSAADQRDKALALSRLVASKADRLRGQDVPLAMQLALAAYRIAPTLEARSSLLNTTAIPAATRIPASSGAAESVSVSRHGRLLAAGTALGTVQLWTVASTGEVTRASGPLKGPGGPVTALASSTDGRIIAGACGNSVYLWDAANLAHPVGLGKVTVPTGDTIASTAISPDNGILAAGGSGRDVYMWNIKNPAHPLRLARLVGPAQPVTAVAFTPRGRILAAGSQDSRVYLWSLSASAHPDGLSPLTGPSSEIFSIAISGNGRYLAAGTGAQHSVYLWNITDPAHPESAGPPLTGPATWVNTVAFSPDDQTLAAGSSDSQLWLYNLSTRQPIGQLPHPSPVTAAVYRNNASLVTIANDGTNGTIRVWNVPGPVITGAADAVFAVSFDATGHKLGIGPGAQDNTLRVWNTTEPQHPFQLGPALANTPGASRYSGSGALTPDGRIFAAGGADGTIQLWDIADPAHPARLALLRAAAALVESVTISSDGRLLAVSSDDGAVHLFSIANPRHPGHLADLRAPSASPWFIYQAAFNHNAHLLAAASSNHHVYLWDTTSTTHPKLLSVLAGFTEAAYTAVFTSNGHVLAAGGADGTVRLWNITHPIHPASLATLSGPVANVYSIAYDPARHTLAAGSTDGTIWLWDLTSPANPADLATLTGPSKGILAVAFSPDGHTLAAGSEDRTVRLWNTDPATAATWICSTAGQPITRQEWAEYVAGTPYSPPCR